MSDDREWMDRKACVASDVDPEAFFPNDNKRETKAATKEAKAVCGRCLVRAECRQWAEDHPTLAEFGIWGGLDEQERRALRLVKKYPKRPNMPTWDERCGTYAGTKAHIKRLEQFCDDCRVTKNEYEADRKRRQTAARRESA